MILATFFPGNRELLQEETSYHFNRKLACLFSMIIKKLMDKNSNTENRGKAQDNIGYENTKKRNDKDDREMNRLQTTDTDNDEDEPVNVQYSEDINNQNEEDEEDDDDDNEEKVFGQL
jgi:hypothetical protein